MAQLIYRVVSVNGTLGYGYPRESLAEALKGRVDAIVADGGSMHAGPYYLGSGSPYFDRSAIAEDFRHMAKAGRTSGAAVIVGSCGMAGGNRNLELMIGIAKETFEELALRDARVAVIGAELAPDLVIRQLRVGLLRSIGLGIDVREEALRESTIVGQMGIHPIITALDAGAQYVLAGRCCDSALFAADMIRRGIDAGLAYHVGAVLECGALAADPGSPCDCLVAEIYDDGTALFVAPNRDRRCTPLSIAAHALYEEGHPYLQFYPEGVLALEGTEFFARDTRTAGIRHSSFVSSNPARPAGIKLEGARRLGACRVSLIRIDAVDLPSVPAEVPVYGRNGVAETAVSGDERELGIIIETSANSEPAAVRLAELLSDHLHHYGYPGRRAAAGNLAYPLSPRVMRFERPDGTHGAIVPGGTRNATFIANFACIKAAVIALIEEEYPQTLADADYRIAEADASSPIVLLRTVEHDHTVLDCQHARDLARIAALTTFKDASRLNLTAADVYEWSLNHLLHDEHVIRGSLFQLRYFEANGRDWVETGRDRPRYMEIGTPDYGGDLDARTLSAIADAPPGGIRCGEIPLVELAGVIRSKLAGIDRVTFDIIFTSAANYEAALRSNLFFKDMIAATLGLPTERVVGTYFVDSCNAIKITVDRPSVPFLKQRDILAAHQQAAIERLTIPLYAEQLAKGSAF